MFKLNSKIKITTFSANHQRQQTKMTCQTYNGQSSIKTFLTDFFIQVNERMKKCGEINKGLQKVMKYKEILSLCFSILLTFFTFSLILFSSVESKFNERENKLIFSTIVSNLNVNQNIYTNENFPNFISLSLGRYPIVFFSISSFILSLFILLLNAFLFLRKTKQNSFLVCFFFFFLFY